MQYYIHSTYQINTILRNDCISLNLDLGVLIASIQIAIELWLLNQLSPLPHDDSAWISGSFM